ncbi:DUF6233 domain-containing protein [Streptomyces brevispora]|uniref:DUF6233 domain-containing protein n=1 Tax=Streptomyces brevispora TaxID=887462 RepID=UPI003CC7701E
MWRRRQTETGWLYLVGLPSYRDREDGAVETAEYRVWVRAADHVWPVDGVDYGQVATEHLPPVSKSVVREVLGERRPSGWALAKVREGRGPARGRTATKCRGARRCSMYSAPWTARRTLGRGCARCAGALRS